MIFTDLERVSKALNKLLESLEPLGLVTDFIKEEASGFEMGGLYVKQRYLKCGYVVEMEECIEQCALQGFSADLIENAKQAVKNFGDELLKMEFETKNQTTEQAQEI
jgi:hypothetical protein